MTSNQAAWLIGAGKPLEVGPSNMPTALPGNVVIRNRALAFCPVEHRIQDSGLMVQQFPIILGWDIAGEVIEVGEGVEGYSKGDRIMAFAFNGLTGGDNLPLAGAQEYVLVRTAAAVKIPDDMPFTDAVVLPLGLGTAAAALYMPDALALPLPSVQPKPVNKVILVWGGSSSVGISAIQLAKASGVTVITTASPSNAEMIKSQAGADQVFDYRSPTVLDDLVAAVNATGKEFAGVVDPIAEPSTVRPCIDFIKKLGHGSKIYMYSRRLKDQDFEGVDGKFMEAHKLPYMPWLMDGVYKEFAANALPTGQLKPLPKPLVAGKGLGSAQKALDTLKAGVSARKVVIEV